MICAAMLAGCGKEEASIEPSETVATEAIAEVTEEATEEIEIETETEEVVEATEVVSETEQSGEDTKTNGKKKSGEQDTSSTTSSSSSEASSESVSDNSSSDTSNTPSNDTPSSGDIIYNGSVTLPSLGISIVCPNQYVSSGLTYNDILNNANAFTNALNNKYGTNAQGMTWNGNAYGFYTLGYNSTPNSQIKYNGDGTYTLIIGAHFGGGYQSLISGVDITSLNADAILCEIATMSSTPQSVYNGIYDMFYGTTIYDASTWYTFGDCKVSYSSNGSMTEDVVSMVLTLKKA